MKPHRVAVEEEGSSGIRLGVILSVAAAVTLLSAMASFSVLNLREKSAARTVAYSDSPSPATSLPPCDAPYECDAGAGDQAAQPIRRRRANRR
ncbi:hypothetical protein MTO96_035077 [Rhipicephalus appendiculatus]